MAALDQVHGATHAVRAKIACGNGHEHDVCIPLKREVHPDLRCQPQEPQGFSFGGSGCVLPADMEHRAERELRDNYQESRRRGWVLIS